MIPYTAMQSYIAVFWQSDRAFELRVVGTLLLFLLFLVVQTAVLCEAYRHLVMKRRHADVVGSFDDMITP